MIDDAPSRGQGTEDGTQVEDGELLRRYVEERSETAFGEFVQRHLGLVYAAALRRTDGDEPRAAEVAKLDVGEALAPFELRKHLSAHRTQGVPNMIALVKETAERSAAAA